LNFRVLFLIYSYVRRPHPPSDDGVSPPASLGSILPARFFFGSRLQVRHGGIFQVIHPRPGSSRALPISCYCLLPELSVRVCGKSHLPSSRRNAFERGKFSGCFSGKPARRRIRLPLAPVERVGFPCQFQKLILASARGNPSRIGKPSPVRARTSLPPTLQSYRSFLHPPRSPDLLVKSDADVFTRGSIFHHASALGTSVHHQLHGVSPAATHSRLPRMAWRVARKSGNPVALMGTATERPTQPVMPAFV